MKSKNIPKKQRKFQKAEEEKTYGSFEQWKKENFPNLSERETVFHLDGADIDVSRETLEKLRHETSFNFINW